MFETKNIIPFQVSKWVKIPLLVDVQEMEELIQQLPAFKVYDVQRVTAQNEGIYDPAFFLERYSAYVAHLKNGEVPPLNDFRGIFSAVWSVTEEALYSLPVQEGRRLIKVSQPAVQTQLNQIRYDTASNEFRTQIYSSDSICWGIQMGFPHLYLDPITYEADNTRDFPNMPFFQAIQRWVRFATAPTPFVINGTRINAPIRLGKGCFSWIASHPQLKEQGICIERGV